ncbi:MAG: shikimate dehydrogenase family protein, partial [Alphaproteobacteria bacterium]
VYADNTDGVGLLGAFAAQAPQYDVTAGPSVVLGAGGAARGAVSALLAAGSPRVWIVNRTLEKAEAIAADLGRNVSALPLNHAVGAFKDTRAIINATSAGLSGEGGLDIPLELTAEYTVVMDMVYKPLETPFLKQARELGRATVDGLEMLIRQAEPSFEAFYGQPPPEGVDVRGLALKALNP